jgi:hypothetical protein
MKEIIDLFTLHDVGLSIEAAKYAYGMSKMIVVKELENTDKYGYQVMEFVEFLEMICRVAVQKFKHSDLDSLELPRKVEFVVEELL